MKTIFIICFLTMSFPVLSQKFRTFKNSIYAEIGGNGGDYAINYERLFRKKIVARIGIGKMEHTSIPVLAGKLFGFGKGFHHLAIMGGVSRGYFEYVDNGHLASYLKREWRPTAFLGYRYMRPGDRFLFHAAYTPFFANTLIRSMVVGAGYRFSDK